MTGPPRKAYAYRIPVDIADGVREVLKARGWTVEQFVVAALATALEDPAPVLALIEDRKPAKLPAGRPRKAAAA